MSAPWRVCGATRTGGTHARQGIANQDSWRPIRRSWGVGAVVCDGLGSRPSPAIGSRAACAAVSDALRLRARFPAMPEETLIRAIHLLWGARIAPLRSEDCATTCLFALAQPDGSVLAGQLGDGAILLEEAAGDIVRLSSDRDFAGPTNGLGVATDTREWTLRRLEPGRCRLVMLASDGVSDDLFPDRPGDFVRHLRAEILGLPAPRDRDRLALMLERWPTPGYSDDKTIAALWRPGG